jgi:5-methylcytosine-specific restriction endonuclease McrA
LHFAFYTSPEWRALRQEVLATHPPCAMGCGRTAIDVDHIISRRLRPDLGLAIWNLRPLCRHCHGWRTRREP